MGETKENKPQRGRPAKEKEKLTRSINLKLTESDFEIITERAAKVGMKATQYARQMVLNGKIKPRYTKEELDLRRKIAGMANNMNQVARVANRDGFKEAEFIAYHLFIELNPCYMIAKNKKGKSFGGCVRYVLNEGYEILDAEGVLAEDAASITRDFAIQRSGRPEIKQPVGHIAVSFSPEDSPRMTNDFMLNLAHEYMDEMGIRDTQYLIVRHRNTDHDHFHIVYNRIDNDLKLISVNNDYKRNIKTCKKLKDKHGLTYGMGKEKVNRPKLTGADKVKYQIHDEIVANLPHAPHYADLEKRLRQAGISIQYKYRSGAVESPENIQGVSFKKGNYSFKGSEIDRKFSHANLLKVFQNNIAEQKQPKPQPPVNLNPVIGGVELTDEQVKTVKDYNYIYLENIKLIDHPPFSAYAAVTDDFKRAFFFREPPDKFVKYGKYEMREMDKRMVEAGCITKAKVKWYGIGSYAYPYLWKDKPEDAEYKEQFGDPRIPKEVHEKRLQEFDERIRRNIPMPKKNGPKIGG